MPGGDDIDRQKFDLEKAKLDFEVRKFEGDAQKRELEAQKLIEELRELRRPWYNKSTYLSALAGIIVAIVGGMIAFGTDVFKSNVGALIEEKKKLSAEQEKLSGNIATLTRDRTKLDQENNRLAAAKQSLEGAKDRLDSEIRRAAIERDHIISDAQVGRLIATLGSSSDREKALWELYRSSREVRSAVLSRIFSTESSAELLSYRIEEIAYAATGVHPKDILGLQQQLQPACARVPASDRYREIACAAALAAFGPSPDAGQFMVDHALNTDALRWVALMPTGLDAAQRRRVLQVQIPMIIERVKRQESGRDMFLGIAGLAWNRDDESTRQLVDTMRSTLQLPVANPVPPALLIQYLPALPDLPGQEARELVEPFVTANPLMDYWYDWPREWLDPVKRIWPRRMIEEVLLDNPANFTSLCFYLMQWNLDSADLRDVAVEMVSARQKLSRPDISAASFGAFPDAVATLANPAGRPAAEALFEGLLSTRTGIDYFTPPLLRAIAETHFRESDYLSILPRVSTTQMEAGRSEALYKILFAAFMRRFPEPALQFAISSLRAAPNPGQFRIVAEAFGQASSDVPSASAVAVWSEMQKLQPLSAACSAFLPLVTIETIPDAMEVLKWPTCSGDDRRSLAAKISLVKGRQFAWFRHSTAIVNWSEFAAWAESQGFAETVTQPQARTFKAIPTNGLSPERN